MWKLLPILLYFVRETVFDSKDEYNFKSNKFNARKFMMFLLVLFSIIVSISLTLRTYDLAKENLRLEKEASLCKKQESDSLDSANSDVKPTEATANKK